MIFHKRIPEFICLLGLIGKIQLQIPWSSLGSKPAIVKLENIFLLVGPKQRTSVSAHVMLNTILELCLMLSDLTNNFLNTVERCWRRAAHTCDEEEETTTGRVVGLRQTRSRYPSFLEIAIFVLPLILLQIRSHRRKNSKHQRIKRKMTDLCPV